MKKISRQKLNLKSETLRQLSGADLSVAVGGATTTSKYPLICSPTQMPGPCGDTYECPAPSANCITTPMRTCGPIVIA